MPSSVHKVKLPLSNEHIWEFVSKMNNWAPLVPGYMEHEILNDRESTWKFKTDVGLLKKKIHLKVDILEWKEPTKVTFNLTGINEKFFGDGYFEAKRISNSETEMIGCLTIEAEGTMGKMVNSILKNSLPDLTLELTNAVANKILEVNEVTTKK